MSDFTLAALAEQEAEQEAENTSSGCVQNPAENEHVEPVAYRHLMEDGWEYYDAPTGEDCAGCQPLYATPIRRDLIGLTDEQRLLVIRDALGIVTDSDGGLMRLARAIEGAVMEQNR